uniref:GRF-type domain-containing protein n=1 Tax=Triticum urartu TaxID=4572 RepID=A0A8R7R1M6_TRIUA
MLPLVPCPSCRIRFTIRLVSKSEANPGRIFYKCPNHHIPPNPCQHYYWEDGPDNYFNFLVRGGYVSPGLSSFDSAGVIASEETE